MLNYFRSLKFNVLTLLGAFSISWGGYVRIINVVIIIIIIIFTGQNGHFAIENGTHTHTHKIKLNYY